MKLRYLPTTRQQSQMFPRHMNFSEEMFSVERYACTMTTLLSLTEVTPRPVLKQMENSKASEQGWRVEDTEVVIDPDSVALARAARTGGSTRSEATLDGRFAIDVELSHLRTGYSARATVQTNDSDAISADPAKREAWRLRVLHQKVSQMPL